jgi:hypothetical protein
MTRKRLQSEAEKTWNTLSLIYLLLLYFEFNAANDNLLCYLEYVVDRGQELDETVNRLRLVDILLNEHDDLLCL